MTVRSERKIPFVDSLITLLAAAAAGMIALLFLDGRGIMRLKLVAR